MLIKSKVIKNKKEKVNFPLLHYKKLNMTVMLLLKTKTQTEVASGGCELLSKLYLYILFATETSYKVGLL